MFFILPWRDSFLQKLFYRLAERDIRNVKLKQKLSGSLRSNISIANFAKISSIISTASKQGRSVFNTIKGLFAGTHYSLVDCA